MPVIYSLIIFLFINSDVRCTNLQLVLQGYTVLRIDPGPQPSTSKSPFRVRQELAIESQKDPVTLRIRLPVDGHFTVDHRHDTIPKLLVNDSLDRMAIDQHGFV